MRRTFPLIAAVVVIGAVVGLAGAATAHVEVQPAEAPAGQPATFSFRMPNEDPKADTISLQVRFPAGPVVTGVAAPPMDGWTIAITNRPLPAPVTVGATTVTEVVDTITWTGALPPGRADYFNVTTGPLPSDAAEIVFSATQTYSDGQVVVWDQPEVAGGAEPAHPAPVLTITGATAAVATTTPALTTVTTAAAAQTEGDGGSSNVGTVMFVAVIAVIVAGGVLLYRSVTRRQAKPEPGRKGPGAARR